MKAKQYLFKVTAVDHSTLEVAEQEILAVNEAQAVADFFTYCFWAANVCNRKETEVTVARA